MVKKIILLPICSLLAGCVSQGSIWQGSLNDFAESYVREIDRMNAVEERDSSFFSFPTSIINFYIFSISRAEAKGKKNKKPQVLINSPKIRELQKRQAVRLSKIEYYKLKKNIGEKEDGLLGIRSIKSLPMADKKKVQELVGSENKDREILYSQIIKQNKYDKKMQIILRKSFFESYQNWAPMGSYYYKNGQWLTKGKMQ